ncbi:MAG: hypothetical protein ABIP55_10265 [Tepidisphaeraceae bacterium]
MSDPADEGAFSRCAQRLRDGQPLAGVMAETVVWGNALAGRKLADHGMTRFGSPLFRQLYLSLFMFSGEIAVDWNDLDDAPRLLLGARFRDGLKPGQFPYPFWHSPAKWNAYQEIDRVVLQFDSRQKQIVAALRAIKPVAIATLKPAPISFDGKWTWQDADGRRQPVTTLFDGVYRHDNPAIGNLDQLYRSMALELRAQDCLSCHVPDNPNAMRRLVLLQSPAHAASEIEYVIESVRAGRMPQEEWGSPRPFPDEASKQRFLGKAQAFADAVRAADVWEKTHPLPP